MKKSLILLIAVLALVILWGVSVYNTLVKQQEGVSSAWSQVENVYQRRSDLIPNLVATVKGYAQHESSTLEAVVEARANATGINGGSLSEDEVARYQQAQGKVSGALSRLLAIVENYPELKANENFLDLQAQLEGTENRIAEARRQFNETAKGYNTKVRSFPSNFVAKIFGFETKGYFEAEEAAKTAPKVEF